MKKQRVLAFAVLLVALVPVRSQPPPKNDEPFDYRRFFKKPTNTKESWEALQFELEVGRYDLAAQHLRQLLQRKPTPEELVALHEKVGIAGFLRLRMIPRWSEDRAKDRTARQDVESLIDQVTAAVRAKLSDPVRIKLFIKNLFETPEERAFALRELSKSGAAAVPFLIDELRARPEAQRGPILSAVSQFGTDTVPPLLAALDIPNEGLRENIIDILTRRPDFTVLRARVIDPAPFLWPLASPLERSPLVRDAARKALVLLYDVKRPDQLPPAKEALTAEAEKYYYHKARFLDPRQVTIWRWDGMKLVEDRKFTQATAEEYYGQRFARQALAIDPKYEPAQIVLLSLLLDRGHTAPTADKPLGALSPKVEELLATLNPDLIGVVLDRALRDQRTPVVLAAVRALGNLADARSLRPGPQGEPPLVRALAYGDRRVQLAAVDSILRIPGSPATQITARIVDILKRALLPEAAASTRPRVVVALAEQSFRNDVSAALKAAGADPLPAATGRAALRRLKRRADIDAVVIDSVLPDPGLPFLLAQLRADRDLRRLPVLLAAVAEPCATRDLRAEIDGTRSRLRTLDREIQDRLRQRGQFDRAVTPEQAAAIDRTIRERQRRKERLEAALQALNDRYDAATRRREEELTLFVARYPNVWVVPASLLTDPRLVEDQLGGRLRDAGLPPLSKAERAEFTETALRWLVRMATGELKGFDVRPAAPAVLRVLQGPPPSEPALLSAVRIVGTLPGPEAQKQLVVVLLDKAKPPAVRVAAADELQRHVQQFGRPDPAQDRELKRGLRLALEEPKLPPPLRERLTRLIGTLRPDPRTTGERLRDFKP